MAEKDPINAVNDQITDAVSQIHKTILGAGESFGRTSAYQMMAHAIGLAMLNTVANQQQSNILRQAITTAAVKSILESKPEEAIKLADKLLSGQDVVSTFAGLKEMMDDVLETMARMKEQTESGVEPEKKKDKKEDKKKGKK